MKTFFLVSNSLENRKLLQLEDTNCVMFEVEVDTSTNEFWVYGNNFDLQSQEFLGCGEFTEEELEFFSSTFG